MKAYITLLLVCILLVKVHTIEQSWSQFVEAGTVNPTITVANGVADYFTFSLISTKTNNNYRVALALSGIRQQPYPDGSKGRYSFDVRPYALTTSTLSLQIITKVPTIQITNLEIRYLTVQSTFQYIDIAHFSQSFSWMAYSSSTPSSFYPLSASFSLNQLADYVIHVISGYDIKDPNGSNQEISLESHCQINPGPQLECQVKSLIASNCFIDSIRVDVIVFHQQLMQTNMNGDFSINSLMTATTNQQFSLGIVIDATLLFYGLKQITKTATTSSPYQFSVGTYSQGLDFAVSSFSQTIQCFYMYFVTTVACIPSKYYNFSSQQCQPCTSLTGCLSCMGVDASGPVCLSCDSGYQLSAGVCRAICGDGIILGSETCDDNNKVDKDGCSSSCQVEDYFDCGIILPSVCRLTQLDLSVKAIGRAADKNQLIVSIDLYPKRLLLYDSADWTKAFIGYSHDMNLSWVKFDSEANVLRAAFSYNQNLQNQHITLSTDFSLASSVISSTPSTSLTFSLPSQTTTNQALYHYSSQTYSMARIAQYLALFVVAFSFLLMALGYFGCKLQTVEAIAVVQVTALLMMSVNDMAPTYEALLKLCLPLGVTILSNSSYIYEESTVPRNILPLLPSNTPFTLINIFLLLIILPLLVSLICKILSITIYKDSFLLEKIWKYSLGSYTYYGILLLAYGQFALLAMHLRYFKGSLNGGIGLLLGIFFALIMVAWVVGSYKYPQWFGCFKKKFYKFEISYYVYIFFSGERFLTTILIVCLSPGLSSIIAPCCLFIIETLFIAIKRPYTFGYWKRPLFNKIIAVVICLLFLAPVLTKADSFVNQIVPLVILVLLVVVLIIAMIGSIYELYECWMDRSHLEEKKKEQPALSVEDAQSLLIQQFQMRLLPKMLENGPSWRPIQQNMNKLEDLQWQNYPKLISPSSNTNQLLTISKDKLINPNKQESKTDNIKVEEMRANLREQVYGQI